MKKTLLSICVLLVATATFAQQVQMNKILIEQEIGKMKVVNNSATTPVVTLSNSAAAPAPIWSEDFANGIPSTWTNSTAPWVYRGPLTSPNTSVGSQGAYASNGTPILSPTVANGFIIFDSD